MKLDIPNREQWVKFTERTSQRMGSSAICINIFTPNYSKSIDSLLQFALAIILDKPIYLLAPEGTNVPNKVKQIASAIEFYIEGDMASMQEATTRLLKASTEKGFSA